MDIVESKFEKGQLVKIKEGDQITPYEGVKLGTLGIIILVNVSTFSPKKEYLYTVYLPDLGGAKQFIVSELESVVESVEVQNDHL